MINKSGVREFNGCRLYTVLVLDYRLRLWAPPSASRAISAVADLLVTYTTCPRKKTNSFLYTHVIQMHALLWFLTSNIVKVSLMPDYQYDYCITVVVRRGLWVKFWVRKFPPENFWKFPEAYSNLSGNFRKFINYLCQSVISESSIAK